jgi:hypothetical protein
VAGSTREISGLCSLLVRVVGYKVMRTLIRDWAGQLVERGEFLIGRMRVV